LYKLRGDSKCENGKYNTKFQRVEIAGTGLACVGAQPDCTVENVEMGQTGRKVHGRKYRLHVNCG